MFKPNLKELAFAQASQALHMYKQAKALEAERERQIKEALEQKAREEREAAAAAAAAAKKAAAEKEAAEQAERDALWAKRERMEAEILFQGEPANLKRIFDRYKEADVIYRNQIRDSLNKLLSDHLHGRWKIDFAGLPFEGKMICLPAYLDLQVGKDFPRIDFERSDWKNGSYVFITRHGPADAMPWREKMGLINRYLGDQWAAQELDGTSVKLWRLPVLPHPMPFQQSLLKTGAILFGADRGTGQPYYTSLSKLTHLLVTGQPGKGKSIWANTMMASLLWNLPLIERITLVDRKMVELNRYAGIHPKISLVTEYDDLLPLVQRLLVDMTERYRGLRDRGEVLMHDRAHFVVIEEFGSIMSEKPSDKAGKEKHDAIMLGLNKIGQLGRAANIKLIITSQRPTADNLDTNLKANLPSAMSFAMSSPQNVTAMFSGEILPADVTTLPQGEFVYRDDGQANIVHLKGYYRDPLDIAGMKACIHPSERIS